MMNIINNRIPSGNCFIGDTEFITKHGIINMKDHVREIHEVYSLEGEWRSAVVMYFGRGDIWSVKLSNGSEHLCTDTHDWIVKTHSDEYKRIHTSDIWPFMILPTKDKEFVYVKSIENLNKTADTYCLVQPHSHSFTLSDGVITGNCTCDLSRDNQL